MANRLSPIGLLVVFSVILALASSATERVAKTRRIDVHPDTGGVYYYWASSTDSDTLDDQNSFVTYTAPETDSLIQPLKDKIKQDEEQITILKANNKALADANDALTKRLDDLELRINKVEQK